MENRNSDAGKRGSVEKRPYQTTADFGQLSGFVLENSTAQSLAMPAFGKTIKAVLGEMG